MTGSQPGEVRDRCSRQKDLLMQVPDGIFQVQSDAQEATLHPPLFSSALAVPTLPRVPIPVSVDICPHPPGCVQDMKYGDLGLGSPGSHAMPSHLVYTGEPILTACTPPPLLLRPLSTPQGQPAPAEVRSSTAISLTSLGPLPLKLALASLPSKPTHPSGSLHLPKDASKAEGVLSHLPPLAALSPPQA